MRGSFVAVAALLLVGDAAHAQAPPARVDLRWTAPSECPGSSQVVAEVERILGARPARAANPLEVSATVTGTAGGYEVRVQTVGSDGPRVRTLQGRTCAALANATALVIALVIDPSAVPGPPPRETPAPAPASAPSSLAVSPTAISTATPAPTAPPQPSGAVAAPPRRPERADKVAPAPDRSTDRPPVLRSLRLAAWGGADVGSLPHLAAGLGIEAAVLLGPFRVELGGELYPKSTGFAEGSVFGGDVDLVAGYAGVCLPLGRATVEVGPCVAMELGRMHAVAVGDPTDPDSGSALWTAPRVEGLLGWFPWPFAGLRLRAGAAFPITRPAFFLENVGTVHQPGRVAGRLEGGLETRF